MRAAPFTDDLRTAAVIACLMVQNAPDLSPALTAALQTRRPSEILADPELKQVVTNIYAKWRRLEAQREIRIHALCDTGMNEQEAREVFNMAVSRACIAAALTGGKP